MMRRMKKMKLFSHVRQDTCPYCYTDKAIELYDKNDNGIRFSHILNINRLDLLNIRQIYYGECKKCHQRFLLDWTNSDRIPVPLSDGNMLNYIKHYSESRMT